MADVIERIHADLKQAMLAHDKNLVTMLRSLKSAILYKEVESGKRDTGLNDQEVLAVLKKEKKSRQDALQLYEAAGEKARAEEETYQISVIDKYLPQAPSEAETKELVRAVQQELDLSTIAPKDMGAVMKAVREKNPNIDGSTVAKVIQDIQKEENAA